MKRIALVVLICTMFSLLSGCTGKSMEHGNAQFQIIANSGSIFVYTIQDEETGVWYICNTGGVSPRYNPDGTLYVSD